MNVKIGWGSDRPRRRRPGRPEPDAFRRVVEKYGIERLETLGH